MEVLEVDWKVDDSDGNFVRPIVFTDVAADMRIHREEIFGPVLVVMPFDSEDETVELANNSDFGLAGSIWTENLRRAERVGAKLKIGPGVDQHGPFASPGLALRRLPGERNSAWKWAWRPSLSSCGPRASGPPWSRGARPGPLLPACGPRMSR